MKTLTNKEILKLKELIYRLDVMGVNNIMVRNHFDRIGNLQLHKPKNWSKYIKEFNDILNVE